MSAIAHLDDHRKTALTELGASKMDATVRTDAHLLSYRDRGGTKGSRGCETVGSHTRDNSSIAQTERRMEMLRTEQRKGAELLQ